MELHADCVGEKRKMGHSRHHCHGCPYKKNNSEHDDHCYYSSHRVVLLFPAKDEVNGEETADVSRRGPC